MPDTLEILVATTAMFVGAIVAGTAGFGMGMTASPFLLLVLDPRTVVVVTNAMGIAVFSVVLYQSRRDLPAREMSVVAAAGLFGTPFGVFLLSTMSPNLLRIGISVLIMLTAIAVVFNAGTLVGKSVRLGPVVGFVVGAIIAAFAAMILAGVGGKLREKWAERASGSAPAKVADLAPLDLQPRISVHIRAGGTSTPQEPTG